MKKDETKGDPEARRSASQILFHHLPEQTVDIDRGVWKVAKWRDPRRESGVDLAALTVAVLEQARPWTDQQRDNGFGARLASGSRKLEILSLARDRGIDVEPFPKLWVCSNNRCERVHASPDSLCRCGDRSSRNQIHFVCYCRECGALAEPPIARCPTHREVRIRFPGTMAADRIVQDCPAPGCGRELRRGFAGKSCPNCNQKMEAQVHRAASVYTPRGVSIINPPSDTARERIERAGGSAQALSWVVSGLTTRWMDQARPGVATLRQTLAHQGFSEGMIADTVASAIARGEVAPDIETSVPAAVRLAAESEARQIAVGLAEARATLVDLIATAPPGLQGIYTNSYPHWLARAGLEAVDFVDRFPVLTGQFGYTRGPSNDPTSSVLVPFASPYGDYAVYGEMNETEALFVRLDPLAVAKWLRAQHIDVPAAATAVEARMAILGAIGADPTGGVVELVDTLVHSFAHRFVRIAAVHTGVERSALSEFLAPHHLAFFVFAAGRGDFVMGGIQAVFEGELHNLLREIVEGERRCPLDPGCGQNGAACVACLHLGEPSCRKFNRQLNRETLHGPRGYLMP